MRISERYNVLIQARVNFSQSETSSILRGGGGEGRGGGGKGRGGEGRELNFELLLWGRGVEGED